MNKSQVLHDCTTLNNIRIQLKQTTVKNTSLVLFMRITYEISQNYNLTTSNRLVKKEQILESKTGLSKFFLENLYKNSFPYMYETTNQKYLTITQTNLLTVVTQTLEQLEQLK